MKKTPKKPKLNKRSKEELALLKELVSFVRERDGQGKALIFYVDYIQPFVVTEKKKKENDND